LVQSGNYCIILESIKQKQTPLKIFAMKRLMMTLILWSVLLIQATKPTEAQTSDLAGYTPLLNMDTSLNVSVYPNPVSGILVCELESPHPEDLEIGFFDLEGKELYKGKLRINEGMNRLLYDCSRYKSGSYIITFTTARGSASSHVQVER